MIHSISTTVEKLLTDLKERSKELNTLYKVEELLSQSSAALEDVFQRLIEVIPSGWQFPEICQARIFYFNRVFQTLQFQPSPIALSAPIRIEERHIGNVEVSYQKKIPQMEENYFLKEEHKLIKTISDRIGETILYRQLKEIAGEWESAQNQLNHSVRNEWKVVVELLEKTDQKLFILIARKMIYHLIWNGIKEARELLEGMSQDRKLDEAETSEDLNRPSLKQSPDNILRLSRETFVIASKYLSDTEIFNRIQKWIQEDRSSFLLKVLLNIDTSLSEVIDAITRYHYQVEGREEFSTPIGKALRVSMIRRFFSDQLDFINIAKNFIHIGDFFQLSQRIIYPSGSHGRLGGKSSGLFLAEKILRSSPEYSKLLSNLRVPKTWYITADTLLTFIQYNNLEEINEQKYKDLDQIRLEYPNIVQVFKNSLFPPEIIKGLSLALDDFGEMPLIVRSSSLLEDRMGMAFSGKYKSLFLANQGSKEDRLDALIDAIAEVYASVFSPDPIEYRAERGMLDFHEEMGIMVQEVVGIRVDKYFFPAYAGVAFSNNEFRWSARIERKDGLIRLVLGLGTRAVDRMADDYPILISPGKPKLRANVTPEEIQHYSPKKLDLINLETNSFETMEIKDLFNNFGNQIPLLHQYVTLIKDGDAFQPTGFDLDFQKNEIVVSFEGLVSRTPFIKQIHFMLNTLQEKMGTPVDIEFASDGTQFYLLQCRPQSSSIDNVASAIPHDIPNDRTLFTAKKFISNGKIPDISHIVYVDPEGYNRLAKPSEMLDIGKAVSKLNKLLPKRQFILMGPGRWGSRGDIKLGVPVTYSDFNNTAALIEIARKKGNYVPELSFGTHFFQDLVEASIRYIPLYPDDPEIFFNKIFFLDSPNIFADILPEFSYLADVLHVIDIPGITGSLMLRILMNADTSEAIGFLSQPSQKTKDPSLGHRDSPESSPEDHWQWRLRMAETIASRLDPERFGVKEFFVFGSTKNATAGIGSDIDILIHFQGEENQKKDLVNWLEGWSYCLSEIHFLRTGIKSDGLLDVHLVTDEDILKKNSYAVKIGAVTDAARPLPMKVKGSN